MGRGGEKTSTGTEVSKLVVNMNHNSGEIATLGNLAIEAAILGLVLQSVS